MCFDIFNLYIKNEKFEKRHTDTLISRYGGKTKLKRKKNTINFNSLIIN